MAELGGLPLGIGSLPQTDVETACALVLREFPDSPFWPELPRRHWRESMGFEQAAGLPGFHVDNVNHQVVFDGTETLIADLEIFYEHYLANHYRHFSLSHEFAPGFYAMIDMLKKREKRPLVFKGQLTGPTTLGLILKDRTGRALLYHEQMMDVLVKATKMRAEAMAEAMAEVSEVQAIFFDEPMLQSVGSASINIDRSMAVERLREVGTSENFISGCHCCGNTDWSILIEAGMDVIAFDAWNFADSIALYPEELSGFISGGGWLAWGIVPANKDGAQIETGELLVRLNREIAATAENIGIHASEMKRRSLVTPSCGLGSLSVGDAEAIIKKTAAVAAGIKT